MWESAFYAAGVALAIAAAIGILWMAFHAPTFSREQKDIIAAAIAGDVFLAEPYTGPFELCACLSGMPIAGHVAWGIWSWHRDLSDLHAKRV
jgi:hypothetical protein